MSDNNLTEALEIGLFEDYLEKLEKKYYGGITSSGPDKGDPWFHKSYKEMEAEAEKMVEEFMDRNS